MLQFFFITPELLPKIRQSSGVCISFFSGCAASGRHCLDDDYHKDDYICY